MFDPALTKHGTEAAPSGERAMKVCSPDLRQLRFRPAFHGFDRTEVAILLDAVAADYQQVLIERDKLRLDVMTMEGC